MTIQDVIDLLLTAEWGQTPRDVAITRAMLLAYELGLEQGREEAHAPHAAPPQHCQGCGTPLPAPRPRCYCTKRCSARVLMQRMRARRHQPPREVR